MKKIESEYLKEYGDISRNDLDRFDELLHEIHFNKTNRNFIREEIQRILNIKWKNVSFTIYLIPKATPRPRSSILTHTFYVSGAKDNKDIFKKFMMKQDIPMITNACKITCLSYFPIPKSMNGLERLLAEMGYIRPISKPDWDNVAKTYCDMIQDTLLFDDSLIIEGLSKKFYSTKPRIEITLEWMEDYDSKFNFNKLRKKVDING